MGLNSHFAQNCISFLTVTLCGILGKGVVILKSSLWFPVPQDGVCSVHIIRKITGMLMTMKIINLICFFFKYLVAPYC